MIVEVKHPLVKIMLSKMRDKNCDNDEFRTLLEDITFLMSYEFFKDLKVKQGEKKIAPTGGTYIECLSAETVVLVPILRAGLAMSEPIKKFAPKAINGHIGLHRDEKTLKPKVYSIDVPENIHAKVFVFDPMLATGGSASFALKELEKRGYKDISFVSLIASKYGAEKINKEFPNVKIYVASIDDALDEKGYIIPGLGDAGDRLFGK